MPKDFKQSLLADYILNFNACSAGEVSLQDFGRIIAIAILETFDPESAETGELDPAKVGQMEALKRTVEQGIAAMSPRAFREEGKELLKGALTQIEQWPDTEVY